MTRYNYHLKELKHRSNQSAYRRDYEQARKQIGRDSLGFGDNFANTYLSPSLIDNKELYSVVKDIADSIEHVGLKKHQIRRTFKIYKLENNMETKEYNIRGYPVHIIGNPSDDKLLSILTSLHKYIRKLSPRNYFHDKKGLEPIEIFADNSTSVQLNNEILHKVVKGIVPHINMEGSVEGKNAHDFLLDNPDGYSTPNGYFTPVNYSTNNFPFGKPSDIEYIIPYHTGIHYPGNKVLDWMGRMIVPEISDNPSNIKLSQQLQDKYGHRKKLEWLLHHVNVGTDKLYEGDKSKIIPRYLDASNISSILHLFSPSGSAYKQPYYDDPDTKSRLFSDCKVENHVFCDPDKGCDKNGKCPFYRENDY